jgi:hypothetical protein
MRRSTPHVQAMPYEELAALAGLSTPQRRELDADPDLAAELLRAAISTSGVHRPASWAVAAFRKRKGNTKRSARERARSSSADTVSGPPPSEVLDRLEHEPALRAMLGPAVAAALRHHGEPVPDWLTR